ncbi:hypothetical protein SAMN04487910_1837 [Aquimarina amphilecti]|uniref:Uncharacterized protein n=1 Tax=Aquimarina amphilecti TaxID=1038014 RepID=A0A1H7MTW0_AQUAM|nr:hypothetical protein [Aquimarina amphilecti]SEL14115.1 hypothetical protein SAMN04487910_1837 [Aquimarina amphilecti]
MDQIKKLQPVLPLTFQKAEIQKNRIFKQQNKTIAIDYIDTDAMTPYSFYRPISKIFTL